MKFMCKDKSADVDAWFVTNVSTKPDLAQCVQVDYSKNL